MQTQNVEDQARKGDEYLIKTILYRRGIHELTLKDHIYPSALSDFSSPSNSYSAIADDKALSQIAIDSYIDRWTSTELRPEEAEGTAMYIYDYPEINSQNFMLYYFGVLDQVYAAIESRAERAAQNWIKRWNRPLGKDEWFEQLGLESIMFNQFPEKYDRYDIYHRACYLLGQDEALLARTKAAYEQKLREYVLDESLSDFDIKQAIAETSPTQKALLKVSDNTLKVLEKALNKLEIKEKAWTAYKKRQEAGLRLNPHNTDAAIRKTLWQQFKPAPYKEADRIRSIWTYYEKGLPKNRVHRISQLIKGDRLNQVKDNGFDLELYPVTLIGEDLTEEPAYLVEFLAVSLPDDVSNEVHLFTHLADAKACFAFYKDPDKHRSTDTFKAFIIKPDGEESSMSGCRLVEGTYVLAHGKPLFAKDRIIRAGMQVEAVTQQVNHSMDEYGDIRLIMADPLLKSCILTMGRNEDGFDVRDYEQETIRRQIASKLLQLTKYECWETGIRYYKLSSRLPERLFGSLSGAGIVWYHDTEIEEEGNWKGWCTTDLSGLTRALRTEGWSCDQVHTA